MAVKSKNDFTEIIKVLSSISKAELTDSLADDNSKKAFWFNIFNAFNIILLEDSGKMLEQRISRKNHFTNKAISIAGEHLSLDDIEHGMIRKSKIWWSKGYLNKLMVSSFEKQLRVKTMDPRIHFALNCGAESCPAIRFYSDKNIEEQLELATVEFLSSDLIYLPERDLVKISSLFNWYSGDFGGKKGILKFLEKYGYIPENTKPKIIYNEYSWAAMENVFS